MNSHGRLSPASLSIALVLTAMSLPAKAADVPMPVVPGAGDSQISSGADIARERVSLGEVAAIGTGAIVGASLAGFVAEHGLGLVGVLLGAWAGDYYYFHFYGARVGGTRN